jgi:site-specific recombinase XerD
MRSPRIGPYWVINPSQNSQALKALGTKTNAELAKRFSEWLIAQRYATSTKQAYNRVVRKLCEYLGDRPIPGVNHLDIRDFLTDLLQRDLTVEGANRYLWALRTFFDFLYLGGVVDTVVPRLIRGRPARKKLPRVLSEAEVLRLISSAKHIRDRAIVELLYATGCRIGEVVKIKISDINFSDRTIRVSSKGRERLVSFGRTASKLLLGYLGQRRTGFLFVTKIPQQAGCVSPSGRAWMGYWKDHTHGKDQVRRRYVYLGSRKLTRAQAWVNFEKLVPASALLRPYQPHALTTVAVARIINEAAVKAKLGKVTCHMLRHSFANHMLERGADIRHIQELLGHQSLATTQIYTRVAGRELAKTYRQYHPRR